MARTLTIFLLFTAFYTVRGGVVDADPYMNDARTRCVLQAQRYLFNDRFETVDSIYSEQIRLRPGDPLAYVFRAGALYAHMSDLEENAHEALFLEMIDSTNAITARIIDTCDARTAAWMYLFRGHSRAYKSLWEARFGSSMAALRTGLTTIDEYEAGLQVDPELVDLYAGTGSYRYWKSARAGILKWLMIFKDEKDQGLEELRRAADSSLLHREMARSALIWAWLDRHEYDSAISLASEFIRRYPEGRTFRWPLAQAYYRKEAFRQAAEVYTGIREMLLSEPGNYYNLIQCDYYLTQSYSWAEQSERAIQAAKGLREYEDLIPVETLRRQAAKLNYLRSIAKRR